MIHCCCPACKHLAIRPLVLAASRKCGVLNLGVASNFISKTHTGCDPGPPGQLCSQQAGQAWHPEPPNAFAFLVKQLCFCRKPNAFQRCAGGQLLTQWGDLRAAAQLQQVWGAGQLPWHQQVKISQQSLLQIQRAGSPQSSHRLQGSPPRTAASWALATSPRRMRIWWRAAATRLIGPRRALWRR